MKQALQIFKEKVNTARKNRQEKRGIYNVSFNGKNLTLIEAELEFIENAVIDYIKDYSFYYIKGFHDERRDKGLGAEHIKIHLEKGSEGEISLEELLNLGHSLRTYLKIFKEPFMDTDERKIYEWENDEGVRFRVVSDKLSQKIVEKINQMGGSQLPLSPFDNTIITFYSDRNLNQKMEFKNPKVREYYANKENFQKSESTNENSLLTSQKSKLRLKK
ncbi:hypothetical protein [Campylobacter helveticus]|uniref:hypothetical protein n=1 Tax=Campylobacter helveticus TaxID=28898 RepID=UPI0022EA70F4|nr:hypothetical protein [Campylobacter helveticus]